jgi:tripartite-type tricarboxylate transporter receptor subunit TctC
METQMKQLIRMTAACAGIALCAVAADRAAAQTPYPSKPITLVVPFAGGGSADILARVAGSAVAESLKQPVVVDTRAGGGGLVGASLVAKAPPDGYTLLLTTDSLYAINPALYGKRAEEAMSSLMPVVHLAEAPLVIAVSADAPANDFPGFIAWAKSRGTLSFGSPGTGTDHHLLGELISKSAGVPLNHVPYRGSGAALADLAGKQIDSLITLVSTAQPLVAAGKIKVIAVASNQPYAAMPAVSRTTQTLKGTDMLVSYSLMAPAGTPPAVVSKLNEAFNAALRHPVVSSKLNELGLTPTGGTPQSFAQRMTAERTQREGVISDAKIKLTE